jgi:hypothetical protein
MAVILQTLDIGNIRTTYTTENTGWQELYVYCLSEFLDSHIMPRNLEAQVSCSMMIIADRLFEKQRRTFMAV